MFDRSLRRRAAVLLAAGLVAGAIGVGATPTPAFAAVANQDALVFVPTSGSAGSVWRNNLSAGFGFGPATQAFAGDFDATTGGDLFLYNPGPGADGVLRINATGGGGSTGVSFLATPVGGTFTPLVGDFDANGVTDIFWYAPGAAADYLWLFDDAGNHTTVNKSVGGSYRPIVTYTNGDNHSDIIWYGVNAAADAIWRFGPGGAHTSVSTTINGDYTPVVGYFGYKDKGEPVTDVVFYNASGADYLWQFNAAGGRTSYAMPNVDGNYRLIPGQFLEETYGSLFYYGPGSLPEKLFAFGPGEGPDISPQSPPNVSGTYSVQSADFDDNGLSDLAFTSGTTTHIWKFTFEGGVVKSTLTGASSAVLPRAVDMG